ncbi:MAG TPA: polysaccharide biosynthesis tyrosine autokinase [Thermomicrobiales bacterium]|nr:polysaccharide biosynthesis tyrosine autokinase [Thermomicrobiales bacterium]
MAARLVRTAKRGHTAELWLYFGAPQIEGDVDLRRLLAFGRRWGWLVLAGTLLAGGTAFAVATASGAGAVYESTAVLLVGPALSDADANPGQLEASRRVSIVYAEVATSRPVLQRVIGELSLDTTIEAVHGQLTVTTPQEPPIIRISAQADSPELAAALANEVAQQLIAMSPALGSRGSQTDQFIDRQIRALQEEIESLTTEVGRLAAIEDRTDEEDQELTRLRDRLASLRGSYASLVAASSSTASTLLTVIEEAVPNPVPAPRGRLQLTLFAALIGLVLAFSVAFVAEQLDDTIESDEDINAAGLQNLGEIPTIPLQIKHNPAGLTGELLQHTAIHESFHALRTAMELSATTSIRSIVVTSAHDGEGKTTVAALLSVAFAHAGRQVLLIDADLRQPSVHKWFDMENTHGLSDLLRASYIAAPYLQRTSVANLTVLTAGPPLADAASVVGSTRTAEILRQLAQGEDLVVVDSPPMLDAAEASVLAASADWTLVVVAPGRTSTESLRDTAAVLARARGTMMGTVLNRVPRARLRDRMNPSVATTGGRARSAVAADRSPP